MQIKSKICRKVKMARVKNNNEYRTKVSNLMRNALESNPNNQKMLDYSNTLEQVKVDYKNYFDKAKTIVKRAYPKEHCDTLQYFKGLYGSSIAIRSFKYIAW